MCSESEPKRVNMRTAMGIFVCVIAASAGAQWPLEGLP